MILLPQLLVLASKSTKFIPRAATEDVGALAAVQSRPPDPGRDRRNAGLEILRQILGALTRSVQLEDLFPEYRQVQSPCSGHLSTFPLQKKAVQETGKLRFIGPEPR